MVVHPGVGTLTAEWTVNLPVPEGRTAPEARLKVIARNGKELEKGEAGHPVDVQGKCSRAEPCREVFSEVKGEPLSASDEYLVELGLHNEELRRIMGIPKP